MTRQRCLICVGMLCSLALAFLLFRDPEPVRAAPEAEYSFDNKSALKVTMRGPALHFEYICEPDVKRIGGRAFLYGRRVSTTGTYSSVYLPVDEVSYIEQYASVDSLIKAHPQLAPQKDEPAKPADTGKVAPVTEPKKN